MCRELLNAGADVLRGCSIPATGESFGPTGERRATGPAAAWLSARASTAAQPRPTSHLVSSKSPPFSTPLSVSLFQHHKCPCLLPRAPIQRCMACAPLRRSRGVCSVPRADIALIHFHLRTWWLLNDAKAKRCSKLAGRRSMKHGAHLAQPLIAEGAQLSSGGALMI